MAEVERTEQEWRERLSPEQYAVLRQKGTEPPFTGKYTYSKDDGIYRCAACGNELFRSDAKFDSGTGWPSFTEPANAAGVELRPDHSLGMRALRVAPRPRLRRRPRPHGPALLHQFPRLGPRRRRLLVTGRSPRGR
jgi:methionine-R-sulfoxide reductase